jgi:phage terminase large subunit-like protein
MRTQRRAAKKVDREAVGVIDEYEAEMRTGRDSLANLKVLTGDLGNAGRPAEPEEQGPRSGASLVVTGGPPLTKRDQLSTSSQAALLSSPTGGEVAVPQAAAPACGEAGPRDCLSPCGRGYDGRASEANPRPESVGVESHLQSASDWRQYRLGLRSPRLDHLLRAANHAWHLNGRDEQKAPEGDWRTWLLMGGRGSGKTRAGAEWVHDMATRNPLRIALVAETLADAREVMVDGVSGLWRIAQFRRPSFEISRRRLVWPNGSVAQLFSSEDPESLRGPQFDLAWCDELGKWKHARETWDMLQFGLRLGTAPRQVVTTTPRAIPLLKAILADPGTVTTKLSTLANAGNLAPGFIRAMEARYGGTRLGRQELDGELIEDREDALWSRDMLERARIRAPGPLSRIVVAVDPPAAERAKNSCCGIVVAGVEASGRAAVLADLSVANASPGEWGAAVVRAYRRFQADRVVAEVNQGGDMVATILHTIDAGLPVTNVRAMRGKYTRAEPVAALYEQGRVAHAGTFPALEDQMCDFGADGLSGGNSPDRLDALVWALTALMLTGQGEPRVRGM